MQRSFGSIVMKSSRNITRFSFVLMFLFLFSATETSAQFGPYSRALKRAKKVKKDADDRNRDVDDKIKKEEDNKKTIRPKEKKKITAIRPKPMGKIVFSKASIDALHSQRLATDFKGGDNIYGLLRLKKPLKLLNSDGSWYEQLDVTVYVDGKQRPDGAFWVREKLSSKKNFIFNVAPKPDDLVSYENYDIAYQPLPESWGSCGGPLQLTKLLGTLSTGKHTIKIVIKHGKLQAVGEFTIEGDFKTYAKLFRELLSQSITRMKLPKPGMVDRELEEQMVEVVRNYGQPFTSCEVLRIVIISPEWQVTELNLGKNENIHFRALHAAVAVRDSKGKFWIFRRAIFVENFDEDNNGYGEMELQDTGFRMETLRKNILPEKPEIPEDPKKEAASL